MRRIAYRMQQHRSVWSGIVLVLFVGLTFAPAIHNDFVNFDDPVYILENSHIQSGLSWETVRWAFSAGYAANWHPLTWLSHALDYELFHLRPWGHHLTSVLLHVANTLLLFIFLNRATGSVGRSLIVAALFGIHPLHVESVAWVSERKDVLSTSFWILGMLSYERYVSEETKGRIVGRRYYILTILFFVLGLLSKPMVITFPLVLLLLDYWPFARFEKATATQFRSILIEKWPFFLLSTASAVVTLGVQRQGGAIMTEGTFSWAARLANVPISLCRYLGKVLLPVNLVPYYPHPVSWPGYQVGLATTGILLLSGLIFVGAKKNASLLFGWLWFLITLFPVLGIIQVGTQAIADRYMYLPSIGLFVAICWLACRIAQQFRGGKTVISLLAMMTLGGLGFAANRQIGYWNDSETLFRHTLRVQPNNILAHLDLGLALHTRGQLDAALVELDAAVRLDPNAAVIYLNRGWVLCDLGRYDEALRDFQTALRISPEGEKARSRISQTDAMGHLLFGIALHRVGALEAAVDEFQMAIRVEPGLLAAYNNLGMVYREQGKLDEAIQAYRSALSIRPAFADAHNNLAITLSSRGQSQEARAEFQRAVELNPGSAVFHTNLGAQLEQVHQMDEAVAQYREALRLAPEYSAAKEKLNQLLSAKQKGDGLDRK